MGETSVPREGRHRTEPLGTRWRWIEIAPGPSGPSGSLAAPDRLDRMEGGTEVVTPVAETATAWESNFRAALDR